MNTNPVAIDIWRMDICFDNDGFKSKSPITIDMRNCRNELSARIVLRAITSLEIHMCDMSHESGRAVKIIINDNDMRTFVLPETIDPETIKSYINGYNIYQCFLKMK